MEIPNYDACRVILRAECEVVKRVAVTIETKVNDKVVTSKRRRKLVSEKLADDQKSGKREKRSKDVDGSLLYITGMVLLML